MVRKSHDLDEMEVMIDSFQKQYGSVHRLKKRVLESGCKEFQLMDDLMIWLTLIKNRQNVNLSQDLLSLETTFELEYTTESCYADYEMSKFLTPKRLEMLTFIKTNPGNSIKELSQHLGRDYKNVYDDIQALTQFELLQLVKLGKSRIPSLPIDNIEINI